MLTDKDIRVVSEAVKTKTSMG